MNTAAEPLKILMVEDSPADQALNLRALRGLDRPLLTECVASESGLREALARFAPDVVLSDFSMPGFSGQEALRIVHDLTPDTPFIFVSGTIGEELAIEAMQRGAADYVLKDNLRRLQPAIERALRNTAERTERRRVEKALQASEDRFRSIVEATHDWVWEIDENDRITYSNPGVEQILGYTAAQLLGRPSIELLIEEDREQFRAKYPNFDAVHGETGWRGWIQRYRHRDGSVRWLESSGMPLRDAHGTLRGYRGADRDITERVQQEAKIHQLARIQAVLSAFGNAIVRASDSQVLLDVACRVAVEQGHFMAACIGIKAPGDVLSPANYFGDDGVRRMIDEYGQIPLASAGNNPRPLVRAFLEGRNVMYGDYATSDAPEQLRTMMLQAGVAAHIALPLGSPPWGALSLYSATPQEFDADEIALLERLTEEIDYAREYIAKSERLEYLAYHNPSTGLPSQMAFRELIVARIERGPQVVAMADVDRFRYFNHTRGRSFGDKLLREIGARLKSLLPPDALFTHPGDDAFVFAYQSDESIDTATGRIEALLAQCGDQPFLVDGEQVHAHLHGSVLLAPAHDRNPDAIERSLVAVLTEAQTRDRPVLAFTEEVRSRATRRVELERELRYALANDGFELFLQPKYTSASQRLTGAEALLRWRHPKRGLVPPAEFIPVLEESGLIVDAGAWVRRAALKISQRWRDGGQVGLRLAVNVSARELRQLNFVSECEELLIPYHGEHGLDIEITESMLMDDIGHSIQVLQALRDLGCKVAIDDFGTGYSSLNYLSRLPADTLKIDQSFVAMLALSPDTLSLVTNIIGLAHSLGLSVVAEGVEDEEQAKLLRLLRCDELQGYFLGRPMPVDQFEQTLMT